MTPDAGAYTAQYEALRARMTTREALLGASDSRMRGVALAVLLQQGVPAWLAAIEPLISRRLAVAGAVCPVVERTSIDDIRLGRAVAPDVLPRMHHVEMTRVLAALVLSTARTARRDLSPAHAREGASR